MHLQQGCACAETMDPMFVRLWIEPAAEAPRRWTIRWPAA